MLNFLKKFIGKKQDPDDFILMNNGVIYNDFIAKEKFPEKKSSSPVDSSVKVEDYYNEFKNHDERGEFNKESSAKKDTYQSVDVNMVNIHEKSKDAVIDELETTIVVPRRIRIDRNYIKEENKTPSTDSLFINSENKVQQNENPFLSIENRIHKTDNMNENKIYDIESSNVVNKSTQDNTFNNNQNKAYNNIDNRYNENQTYQDDSSFSNSLREPPKENSMFDETISKNIKNNNIFSNNDIRTPQDNIYSNDVTMPQNNAFSNNNTRVSQNNTFSNNNTIMPENNVFSNKNNQNSEYYPNSNLYTNDIRAYKNNGAVENTVNKVNQNEYVNYENNMPPINIVPINQRAKEMYDKEGFYRGNADLESTQNLTILQFYKDLNHFKILSEEEKMFLSIEKAKNTLHYFVKVIINPTQNQANFSIKAKLKDNLKEENLWINNVKYDNGIFEGIVGNYPKVIKNVKFGSVIRVNIDDVIDWMFIDNKRLIGGYSIRVARSIMSEQDRNKFDKSLFFFIDEGEDYFREDLTTPEGSITLYEESFRRHDLNIILKCKNFKEEAKIYMLKKFGSFFYDEKSLIDLQESLKLSFIKKIEIEGFKKIDWKKRAFTRRDYIDEDLVLVTEWVFKEDGTKSKLRYYVWRNPNYMWKVLCEEK